MVPPFPDLTPEFFGADAGVPDVEPLPEATPDASEPDAEPTIPDPAGDTATPY
jgi:hypothetical protein